MSMVAQKMQESDLLVKWEVVQRSGEPNPTMLTLMESMFRAFSGQHARTMILWEGGLYSTGKILCSPELREEEVKRWHRHLYNSTMPTQICMQFLVGKGGWCGWEGKLAGANFCVGLGWAGRLGEGS